MPGIWFYSSEENPHPHHALSQNLGLGRGLGGQPEVLTTRLANEETAAGEGRQWVHSHTGQGLSGSAGT